MKTAEQIANEIYDQEESWAWALGREHLVPMMVEAIEAERAQRRELAFEALRRWEEQFDEEEDE